MIIVFTTVKKLKICRREKRKTYKEEAKERSKKVEGEAPKSSRYHEDGKSKRGPKKNRPSMKTGKEGSRRRLKGYKVAKKLKKKHISLLF